MPADSQDSKSGQSEETSQHRSRRADCAFDSVREKPRKQSHQAFAARPVRVVGWENRTNRDRNAIGDEEDEARAEPTPRIGRTIAPTPNSCHSALPIARPQLPVSATGSNVSPRKNPTSRAAMPMSS